MKLISVEKQTGAKRLHRKYIITNRQGFDFSEPFETIDVNDQMVLIEFKLEHELGFLTEVEQYKQIQIEKQSKELRAINVPKVSDLTTNQGTKEWLMARIGKITASDTPFNNKGLKIPTFNTYVNKKVAEAHLLSLGIHKDKQIHSRTLELGHELEPLAIERYEEEKHNKVQLKGFIVANEKMIGASPDGVTTDEHFNKINIEIKSVEHQTYLSELNRGELVKRYYAQMQVQMYILDVDMTHFLVQSQDTPLVKLIIREVARDEEYISNMLNTLADFERDFATNYAMFEEVTIDEVEDGE